MFMRKNELLWIIWCDVCTIAAHRKIKLKEITKINQVLFVGTLIAYVTVFQINRFNVESNF